MISPDSVLQELQKQFGIDDIKIFKIKQNIRSNTYHLVLQIDQHSSTKILAQGLVKLGLNSCRLEKYNPILRCANCQLYGHSRGACRRHTICAICARNHLTTVCPHVNEEMEHRCTNCYNSPNYRKHTADSASCPVFRSQMLERRRIY